MGLAGPRGLTGAAGEKGERGTPGSTGSDGPPGTDFFQLCHKLFKKLENRQAFRFLYLCSPS